MERPHPLVTFVAGVAVLALVLSLVGVEAVVRRIQSADPVLLVLSICLSVGAILARLLTTILVFRDVEGAPRGWRFVLVFFAGGFVRSLLPWGRTSGAPLYAYLFVTESRASFEESLAGIAVVDLLGTAASAVVVVSGTVSLFLTRSGSTDPTGAAGVLALTSLLGLLVFLTGGVLVWLGRDTVTAVGVRAARALEPLGRYSRRLTGVFDPETVRGRVGRFYTGVDAVVEKRRTLVAGLAVLVVGWVLAAAALSVSMGAIGESAPLTVSLFAVAVAGAASAIPLPGGVGSVEAALASVLVLVTTAGIDATAAAALLYRLGSFWLLVSLGAVSSILLFGRLFPASRSVHEAKE